MCVHYDRWVGVYVFVFNITLYTFDKKPNYFLIVQILISAIKIPSRKDMDPGNEFYCSFPCHNVIERP